MITPNRAASRPASTREIGKEIGRAMPTFFGKERGGVGPHQHEAGVAQHQLAQDTGHQVEADRQDHIHAHQGNQSGVPSGEHLPVDQEVQDNEQDDREKKVGQIERAGSFLCQTSHAHTFSFLFLPMQAGGR